MSNETVRCSWEDHFQRGKAQNQYRSVLESGVKLQITRAGGGCSTVSPWDFPAGLGLGDAQGGKPKHVARLYAH